MKAVLIGTDYVHQNDGTLKMLEINTNVGLYSTTELSVFDYLDLSELRNILIDNNINEFHIITPGNSTSGYGALNDIRPFENLCNELSIAWNVHYTNFDAVTVPYIEDSLNKFILRLSYDSTALIDETYCKDMYEFSNLIKNESYSTKKYINDVDLGINNLDNLRYDNYPNLIVKSRFPNYNTAEFPQIYKINTPQDLDEIKTFVDSNVDKYIEEYVISENNLIDNKVNIIRSIDIIYGDQLSTAHLGSHYVTTSIEVDTNDDVYENLKINEIGRLRYSTKNSARITGGYITYHVDADSNILLPDGTTTSIFTLAIGDVVTSPSFYGNGIETSAVPYYEFSGNFSDTTDTFTLNDASVVDMATQTVSTVFVEITLENNLKWTDLMNGILYVELKDSNVTKYKIIYDLEVGDKIITYNKSTNSVNKSAITDLNAVYQENVTIYMVDIETQDIFLSSVDSDNYIIMHNTDCSGCFYNPCGNYNCTFDCPPCKSDVHYKENIVKVGKSKSGINIYQFNYKGEKTTYQGIIAQELIGTKFESALTKNDDGKFMVDYSKIDVEFKIVK